MAYEDANPNALSLELRGMPKLYLNQRYIYLESKGRLPTVK